MAGHRPERVAHLLQQAITEFLQRGKLKDPRIAEATIAEVQVTKDLKVAKVYVQVLGGAEEREETVEGLQSAESFIRRALRPMLSLKQVPQLIFRGDDTAERADRVLGLLAQLERDRKGTAEPPKEKAPEPSAKKEPKGAAKKEPKTAAKKEPKTATKKEPKRAVAKKAPKSAAATTKAATKKGQKPDVVSLDDFDDESSSGDDESE